MKKILIIGGGASGVMAAITAAKNGADVTIYERNDRILKKILVTGNGKCNLSNRNLTLSAYHVKDQEKLRRCFERFNTEDTILFFKSCGLLLKDKNGYLYPACEQASVVSDILRLSLEQMKVRVITQVFDIKVSKLEDKEGFIVTSNEGKDCFDAVIFACGSFAGIHAKEKESKDKKYHAGYDFIKQFGHTLIPVRPSLVQIRCKEPFFPVIAGVRCDAALSLMEEKECLMTERGELQLTDYGISGIPVFQFSGIAAQKLEEGKKLSAMIDFLPDYLEDEWEDFINTRLLIKQGETFESFFLGILHKKITAMLLKINGVKPQDVITENQKENVLKIASFMKQFKVTPYAVNSFEHAQVCSGGVDFRELDDNLQSTFSKNVYFCGEMVDVDGKCGGYNLQWAWTSGYLAGNHASGKCE